jgi:C4-dicarboxylate-binding protein DctP
VVDHVNVARPIHEEWVILMNEHFWDGLDPDAQRILKEAARAAEMSARDKVRRYDEEAVKLIASHAVDVTRIGDADVAAWKSCSSAAAEEYLARSGELGKHLLEAYRKLLISRN